MSSPTQTIGRGLVFLVCGGLMACSGQQGGAAPSSAQQLSLRFLSPIGPGPIVTSVFNVQLLSNATNPTYVATVDNREVYKGSSNSFTWTTTSVNNGNHTLAATVSDGNQSASANMDVMVQVPMANGFQFLAAQTFGASDMEPNKGVGLIIPGSSVRGTTLRLEATWQPGTPTCVSFNLRESPSDTGSIVKWPIIQNAVGIASVEYHEYDGRKMFGLIGNCSPPGTPGLSGTLQVLIGP